MQAPAGTHVVHVTAHYPPFLGGLEKVVESLVLDQRKRGLHVQVLTSLDGQPKDDGSGGTELIRRFRSWTVANTPIIPGLPGALLKLPKGAIVHLHVAHAFVPEAVWLGHAVRGLRYVAHVHIDVGPSGWAGFMLRIWKPLVLGPVLRRSEAVVVFTEEQRNTMVRKYRIDPERVAVIPNGVDENFFHSDDRILHPRPRLLFVGRLSVQKNLSFLLQALAGVSEQFETILVGDGELGSDLRSTATSLGLQNVRFHGRADGAELLELYRNADVFVLPSEREGMPLVLLEAMAMGLPIVATDIAGNRDIVRPHENGILVPLGNVVALRSALQAVSSDPEVYRQMSATARSMASQYSWETVGTQFERLYARVSRS